MKKRVKNTEPIRNRKELMQELSKRFGWRCWYCGARLFESGEGVHVDHIIARANGGTNNFKNLALTCEWCNRAKAFQQLEQFMGWIAWLRSGNSFTPFDMTIKEVGNAIYKSRGGEKEMPPLRKRV